MVKASRAAGGMANLFGGAAGRRSGNTADCDGAGVGSRGVGDRGGAEAQPTTLAATIVVRHAAASREPLGTSICNERVAIHIYLFKSNS